MEAYNLYKDISLRTKGEIFLGVVGPVRTGKSTFIRRFMEQLVLPHLEESKKAAARDELPVSGKGKTITTIEPKFVPKEAAEISFDDTTKVKIRLADCVGFVAEGADGTGEEGRARMGKNPLVQGGNAFFQSGENRHGESDPGSFHRGPFDYQ